VEQTTYYRRKATADCFVKELYDEVDSYSTRCACTALDYQCDFGFVRNGSECVTAGGEPREAMCTDSGMMSTGYRLSSLTKCDMKMAQSVDMAKTDKKCDPSAIGGSGGSVNAGAIAAGVLVPIFLIAAIGGGWWMWRRRGGQIRLPEIFQSGPRYSQVAQDDAEGLMDDY
jgi:hypothetical protein